MSIFINKTITDVYHKKFEILTLSIKTKGWEAKLSPLRKR